MKRGCGAEPACVLFSCVVMSSMLDFFFLQQLIAACLFWREFYGLRTERVRAVAAEAYG